MCVVVEVYVSWQPEVRVSPKSMYFCWERSCPAKRKFPPAKQARCWDVRIRVVPLKVARKVMSGLGSGCEARYAMVLSAAVVQRCSASVLEGS